MQNDQQKLKRESDRILKMIDEVINDLMFRNEKGWYNHTINALMKIRKEYIIKQGKKK
jgi:hypothetical protein